MFHLYLYRFILSFLLDITECPLVAGSVGPYGAWLHDGSEYSGNYIDNMDINVNTTCTINHTKSSFTIPGFIQLTMHHFNNMKCIISGITE